MNTDITAKKFLFSTLCYLLSSIFKRAHKVLITNSYSYSILSCGGHHQSWEPVIFLLLLVSQFHTHNFSNVSLLFLLSFTFPWVIFVITTVITGKWNIKLRLTWQGLQHNSWNVTCKCTPMKQAHFSNVFSMIFVCYAGHMLIYYRQKTTVMNVHIIQKITPHVVKKLLFLIFHYTFITQKMLHTEVMKSWGD